MRLGAKANQFHDGEAAESLSNTICLLFRPELIFLDLNLPRQEANTLIKWVRQQPGFAQIPIIPVPGTLVSVTVQQAEQAGTNLLVIQPPNYDGVINVVYRLESVPVQTLG